MHKFIFDFDATRVIGKTAGDLRAGLEARMLSPFRKIPRNPYTVNNIMGVWECGLVDVQGLSKYNDGIKYL